MSSALELDTAYKLFILLEQLSNLLWDRYHAYLLERHFEEEEEERFWGMLEDPQQDHSPAQSIDSGKTQDGLK